MFILGQSSILVVEITAQGDPVSDPAELADLTVAIRRLDSSPLPAAIVLSEGDDFEVEELLPALGQYVIRFAADAFPETGRWSVHIYDDDGGGPFDPIGEVVVVTTDPAQDAAWLLGRNTFGRATGFDAQGRPTQMVVFGFDNAQDALTYANAYDTAAGNLALIPPPVQALVRSQMIETYIYNNLTQQFDRYVRTIEPVA